MAVNNIFFEGLGLVEGHFSGIGQYILGILKGVDEEIDKRMLMGEQTPKVFVIIPYDTYPRFQEYNFKHIRAKKLPLKFKYVAALWHRGMMPPLDLFFGKGHYIFTRFVTMPVLFSKSSVVIYDLSFELYADFADAKNAKFLSKGTRKSIKSVDNVFTISQNSKREIADFYGFPKSKIYVATPAADQAYFYRRSDKEIENIKRKYGIGKNYILALSNLEPRKNLETLVDAYCQLPANIRNTYSLLLVGVSGWRTDALFSKIKDLVAEGYDIIRPNEYVSDIDKPAIISGTSVLVYPSHYEGFGMPPLEALACGVPVITADNSSLPEVVGDAGTMLDCNDVDGFTRQIAKHLENSEKTKKEFMKTGPIQAEKFDWQKSANVYLSAVLGDRE